MFTLSSFYRSKEWCKFRHIIINNRLNEKGDTICEKCGKVIVNPYDIIAHHVLPLTEANVNNYDISLNPDNVMLVHHKCHNEIHKRFGCYTRHVYLVCGSPLAGKKTYVMNNAEDGDLIVDIDKIYEAITLGKSERVFANVMDVYNNLIDGIKTRKGKWVNAWVIRCFPLPMERERLADLLNAEIIEIDTSREICLSRAEEFQRKYVEDYWKRYPTPHC